MKQKNHLKEVRVQVELSDPTDTRDFKLDSSKAGMKSVLESAYQSTSETDRQTDRAGELGAETMLLILDERDEIRFLVWCVCVYRHTVRGFSATHILSPVCQRQPSGGWPRAGLEGRGFRGPAMRHTFVSESPTALFRLISSRPTLLALPLE